MVFSDDKKKQTTVVAILMLPSSEPIQIVSLVILIVHLIILLHKNIFTCYLECLDCLEFNYIFRRIFVNAILSRNSGSSLSESSTSS